MAGTAANLIPQQKMKSNIVQQRVQRFTSQEDVIPKSALPKRTFFRSQENLSSLGFGQSNGNGFTHQPKIMSTSPVVSNQLGGAPKKKATLMSELSDLHRRKPPGWQKFQSKQELENGDRNSKSREERDSVSPLRTLQKSNSLDHRNQDNHDETVPIGKTTVILRRDKSHCSIKGVKDLVARRSQLFENAPSDNNVQAKPSINKTESDSNPKTSPKGKTNNSELNGNPVKISVPTKPVLTESKTDFRPNTLNIDNNFKLPVTVKPTISPKPKDINETIPEDKNNKSDSSRESSPNNMAENGRKSSKPVRSHSVRERTRQFEKEMSPDPEVEDKCKPHRPDRVSTDSSGYQFVEIQGGKLVHNQDSERAAANGHENRNIRGIKAMSKLFEMAAESSTFDGLDAQAPADGFRPRQPSDPIPPPPKPPRTFQHDNFSVRQPENEERAKTPLYEEINEEKGGGQGGGQDVKPVTKHVPPPRPALPPRPRSSSSMSERPLSLSLSGDRTSISSSSSEVLHEYDTVYVSETVQPKRSSLRASPGRDKESWNPRFSPNKSPLNTMKRCRSDEFIYAEPDKLDMDVYISSSPTYVDPDNVMAIKGLSLVNGYVTKPVTIDKMGYAVPETDNHMGLRGTKSLGMDDHSGSGRSPSLKALRANIKDMQGAKSGIVGKKKKGKGNKDDSPGVVKKKLPFVKQRIRQAFSIVRRAVRPPVPMADGKEEPYIYDDTLSDESESIVDEKELKKRLAHVNTIKERTYYTMERVLKLYDSIYPQLFEYALIVGMKKKQGPLGSYEPYIMYKFPQQVKEKAAIPQFCFPDAKECKPSNYAESESFSFVLTNEDGSREYGYCRRVLPPGSGRRLPEVYCIISPLMAFGLYTQLLEHLEKTRQSSLSDVEELLAAAYGKPLPSPGKMVRIKHLAEKGSVESVLELKRRSDTRLEQVRYLKLFQFLDIEDVMKVFASVLLERRILFCAKKLSTLSTCVHAITGLLYPLSWQHTFIPVLPSSLIDIVCSPTPYIIGILAECKSKLEDLPLEEVLLVDLDNGKLDFELGDELTILPRKCQKALISALKGDGDDNTASNLLVSESFMRFFVETMSHYADHICVQQDGEKVFKKEAFVRNVSSKSIRMFLQWFTETQMFEVFIRVFMEENMQEFTLFKNRVTEYHEEMEEMGVSLTKALGKKVKNIGKQIKRAWKTDKGTEV